jgi:uncharacterized protein (DUF58 family)
VLTRRGWGVCLSSVGFALFGRLLGIPELYAVAVATLAVAGGAIGYVRLWPWQVDAQREVHPPQVHANGSSRVELSVRNLDDRPSPVLSARDPFDEGRRWARFHIAPLEPGELARAAYRLPTSQRGIFPLGPLQIGLTDPFGLARLTVESAPRTTLTVYPRIESIRPLPQAQGADPDGVTGRPSLAAGGEDFYALRAYQTGDDLRRVHWPSTARQDDLMIRQDELPWQGRVTVLADLRASAQSPQSLELTLSAAASIIHAGWRDHRQFRLVVTDGTDTGFGAGHAHLAAIFEYLASADTHVTGQLGQAVSALSRGATSGGVAVVTTDQVADQDVVGLSRLPARFGSVALVVIERSAWDLRAQSRPPREVPGLGRVVRVNASQSFGVAWDSVVPARPSRLWARVSP